MTPPSSGVEKSSSWTQFNIQEWDGCPSWWAIVSDTQEWQSEGWKSSRAYRRSKCATAMLETSCHFLRPTAYRQILRSDQNKSCESRSPTSFGSDEVNRLLRPDEIERKSVRLDKTTGGSRAMGFVRFRYHSSRVVRGLASWSRIRGESHLCSQSQQFKYQLIFAKETVRVTRFREKRSTWATSLSKLRYALSTTSANIQDFHIHPYTVKSKHEVYTCPLSSQIESQCIVEKFLTFQSSSQRKRENYFKGGIIQSSRI